MDSGAYQRRVAVDPEPDRELNELALCVLQFAVEAITTAAADATTSPDLLLEPLTLLADELSAMGALDLYSDWAVPRARHERALDLRSDAVEVSSGESGSAPIGRHGQWKSAMQAKTSTWTVDLGSSLELASTTLKWGNEQGNANVLYPDSFDVQVRADGADEFTTVATVSCKSDPTQTMSMKLATRGRYFRIKCNGFCVGNPGYHALAGVEVFTFDTDHVHTTSQQSLDSFGALLASAAATSDSTIFLEAIRGLLALTHATGSLQSLLHLVRVLLRRDTPLSPQINSIGTRVLNTLDSMLNKSIESAFANNWSLDCGADQFDLTQSGPLVQLSNGNTQATSLSAGTTMAVGSVGFASGKAVWEFRCDRDLSSVNRQSMWYGAAIKPFNATSAVEANPSIFVVRGRNGSTYSKGRPTRNLKRVDDGHIITFTLDHDEHTLSVSINGQDFGGVFTSLPAGKEFFPVVAFTSPGTRVTLMSCKALLPGADSADTNVAELEPVDKTDVEVEVGGRSRSEESSTAMIKARGDSTLTFDLSSESSIKYSVEDAESLTASMSVIGSGASGNRVSARLRLFCDDSLAWTGAFVGTDADSQFIRVVLPAGTSNIEFKADVPPEYVTRVDVPACSCSSCEACSANSDGRNFSLVLTGATLHGARDWSWTPTGKTSTSVPCLDSAQSQSVGLARSLIRVIGGLSLVASKAMTDSQASMGRRAVLEQPFCINANGAVFVLLNELLEQELASLDSTSPQDMVLDLLHIITANFQRLVQSRLDPEEAGLQLAGAAPTLKPLQSTITRVLDSASTAPNVRLAAGAALDAGLSLFYPTPEERRLLLTTLMDKGGVVEMQFKFPAFKAAESSESHADGKQEPDLRFERALLMTQVECEAMNWPCQVEGEWNAYMHLVFQIPTDATGDAVEFLDSGLARIMTKAGFPSWKFPAGCPEPNIAMKIQRYQAFDSAQRNFDTSRGFIHIYPAQAGTFDQICNGVTQFLAKVSPKDDSDAEAAASSSQRAASDALPAASTRRPSTSGSPRAMPSITMSTATTQPSDATEEDDMGMDLFS